MIWYLFLALSPIVFVPIITKIYNVPIDSDRRAKKAYLFGCGFILFLMIALRHNSLGSTDSSGYYYGWTVLSELPSSLLSEYIEMSPMEAGYLVTVWCFSKIFPSAQFLFVLTGLLFSFAICRTIYLNSENSMVSMVMCICLGIYTFIIQGLRQGIAMSICMLSLEACKKRQFVRFVLLILLAMQFHKSAIVFLLVYFAYGFKLNSNTKIGMLVTAGVLFALSPLMMTFGNELMDSDYYIPVKSGALIAVSIYAIILIVAFVFLNQDNTNRNDTFFVAIVVLGASFYLMRYFATQAIERISFYFLIGQAIVLPTVVGKFESKSRKLISLAICILSICLFLYRLNASYGLQYVFFWEG